MRRRKEGQRTAPETVRYYRTAREMTQGIRDGRTDTGACRYAGYCGKAGLWCIGY